MATRTIVQLEDDLTGGPAEESVSFALDGRSFLIALSAANASQLREILAPYIAAGRSQRAGRRSTSGSRRSTSGYAGDVDPATVRAWAQANGYAVSTRGRVSRELRDAYKAANG